MKNILISIRDLQIGGIEKSAITLTNYLIENGYNITLVLEEIKGELLNQINPNINIIKYKPCTKKIIGKFVNGFKRLKFLKDYKNKFDVSISYATYSKVSSFVTRQASINSILWCHADYLELFEKDTKKLEDFFDEIYYDKFSKIVFVSKSARQSFLKVFPKQKNTYYCNNLIDCNKIYIKAAERADIEYNQDITTFLNVGRHDEKQKKL